MNSVENCVPSNLTDGILSRRRFLKGGSLVGSLIVTGPLGASGLTTAIQEEDVSSGVDQLGGPDDLQSSATVRATVFDVNQSESSFPFTPALAFSPAIVWLERGGTVTWIAETGSHSATAYHEENGRPTRIPAGAVSFDSTTLSDGETFAHTFETPGVYNYFCRPHENFGMVGLVIVEEILDGPGTGVLDAVESHAAQEHLADLLTQAGVDVETGEEGGNGEEEPAIQEHLDRFAAVEEWDLAASFSLERDTSDNPQVTSTTSGDIRIVNIVAHSYGSQAVLTPSECPADWAMFAQALGLGSAVACWSGSGDASARVYSSRAVATPPQSDVPNSLAVTEGEGSGTFEDTEFTAGSVSGFSLIITDTGEYFLSLPELRVPTQTTYLPPDPIPSSEGELTVTPGLLQNLLAVTRSVWEDNPEWPTGYVVLSEDPVVGFTPVVGISPTEEVRPGDGFSFGTFYFLNRENVLSATESRIEERLNLIQSLFEYRGPGGTLVIPDTRHEWNWVLTPSSDESATNR